MYEEADTRQPAKYDTGQVPGADAVATERRRANTLFPEPATYAEPDQETETGAEYADVAVAVAAACAATQPGPAYEVPTGPDALHQPRYDSVLTQPGEAAARASADAKGYGAPVYVPASVWGPWLHTMFGTRSDAGAGRALHSCTARRCSGAAR